ncbi:MAG: RNA polymerase sigma factor [Mycobacteriales bacterium]
MYAQYQPRLFCYLRRVMPGVDIEVVVQETFCRVLAHLDEVARLADPWPWLATVARNLARNQIRDNAACVPAGLRAVDRSKDPAPGPEELACGADELRRLAVAMSVLSPVQRRLLSLALVEGLSSAEAGRRLGLREATARQHICRLRSRLSEAFRALGGTLGALPLMGWRATRRGVVHGRWRARANSVGSPAGGAVGATAALLGVMVFVLPLGIWSQHAVTSAGPAVTGSAAAMGFHPVGGNRSTRVATAGVGARASDAFAPRGSTLAVGHASGSAFTGLRYHVWVSRTPTQSGQEASGDITVPTPLGPVVFPIHDKQGGPVLGPACAVDRALC